MTTPEAEYIKDLINKGKKVLVVDHGITFDQIIEVDTKQKLMTLGRQGRHFGSSWRNSFRNIPRNRTLIVPDWPVK